MQSGSKMLILHIITTIDRAVQRTTWWNWSQVRSLRDMMSLLPI